MSPSDSCTGDNERRDYESDYFEVEVEVTTTRTVRRRFPPSRKYLIRQRVRENIEVTEDDVVDVTVKEVTQVR